MAEPYLTQLREIITALDGLQISGVILETKHFFSGAALYANKKICASLSPAGFAIKLPESQRNILIDNGNAGEFRFFPSGPIKRGYVLLSRTVIQDQSALERLLHVSVHYVLGTSEANS